MSKVNLERPRDGENGAFSGSGRRVTVLPGSGEYKRYGKTGYVVGACKGAFNLTGNTLDERLKEHVDFLPERHPELTEICEDIIDAYLLMEESYISVGKLLIAGNGGSASDSERIAGERMKRFKTHTLCRNCTCRSITAGA